MIIVRPTKPVTRPALRKMAEEMFGQLVKGVVDVERRIMALGGELHADEEAALLDDGSKQEHLWGINLYPGKSDAEWIEFDSVINLKPSLGNRSRGVDDSKTRKRIAAIVHSLVE